MYNSINNTKQKKNRNMLTFRNFPNFALLQLVSKSKLPNQSFDIAGSTMNDFIKFLLQNNLDPLLVIGT